MGLTVWAALTSTRAPGPAFAAPAASVTAPGPEDVTQLFDYDLDVAPAPVPPRADEVARQEPASPWLNIQGLSLEQRTDSLPDQGEGQGEGLQGVVPPALRKSLRDAAGDVPAQMLQAYTNAAKLSGTQLPGCAVRWSVLAGIGRVESNHGQHWGASTSITPGGAVTPPILGPRLDGRGFASIRDTDAGLWDGDKRWDRAVGPMQFIPSSWRLFGRDGNDDGIADPHNIYDATLAAAAHLCTSAPGDMDDPTILARALYGYNHSYAYVATVMQWIAVYERAGLDGAARGALTAPVPRAGERVEVPTLPAGDMLALAPGLERQPKSSALGRDRSGDRSDDPDPKRRQGRREGGDTKYRDPLDSKVVGRKDPGPAPAKDRDRPGKDTEPKPGDEDPPAAPREEPSDSPGEQPSDTPSEQPSDTPSEEPSEDAGGEPSEEPSEEPSPAPEPTPTPEPVPEPYVVLSAAPAGTAPIPPGDVSGDVYVQVAPGEVLNRVEFRLDGGWVLTATGAPFELPVDTTQLPDGQHRVWANIFLTNGDRRESTLYFTVANGTESGEGESGEEPADTTTGS